MRPYGILELVRTGRIAMVRSASDYRHSDSPENLETNATE
jgi:hypothetical protein